MSTPLHNNDRGLTPITSALHLTSLYLSLDQLVYIQIAALYYQDNSFFNLFLRWIATTNFVPPTAAALHRVPVVFLLNAVCVLSHILGSSPTPATEHSRGYMDGSVLIDFIGEFSHTSKFKLILQDVLLLSLQVLMMVVGNIKQKAAQEPKEPAQDIDAEEQGVRRAEEDVRVYENGDVEMQSLLPGATHSHAMPPIIELDITHEIKSVIRDNAELYNRVRSNNEEALRAVLQAVATGRSQPQSASTGQEATTTAATATTATTATTITTSATINGAS